MTGYNTDGKAAIEAIQKYYDLNETDRILIFGAGGVAYPILYELSKITKKITIFNEHFSKAKKMSEQVFNSAKCYDLENTEQLHEELNKATVVINATTVGMTPDNETLINESLIKKLEKKIVFFDVVFNPWETRLIKIAKKHGHITISGGYMLIYQAILAMKIWLEKDFKVSEKDVEEIVGKLIKLLKEEHKND